MKRVVHLLLFYWEFTTWIWLIELWSEAATVDVIFIYDYLTTNDNLEAQRRP